ncbi:MAG TPA: iron ABC transporter permease [Chloroflexota bacterium]
MAGNVRRLKSSAAIEALGERAPGTGAQSRLAMDWGRLVWVFAALAMAALVLLPLGWIFASSLQSDTTNQWTLANYVEGFSRSIYLEPIRNSLVIAALVAVVAVFIGTLLAWAVSRTDMPGRGLVRTLVFAAFVTPSFLGAIAWIFLAAPNSGWLNKAAVALTGAPRGPFNIYSVPGAILVISLYSYPYAFTFVASALELMPSELEQSAALLGAGWLPTTLRITLPLARPAILAGGLMSFLEALTEFGTPAFLLIPARQQVMTTQIYLFFQFPSRPNLAAAYAIPLLLVAAALLLLRQRLLGRRRFTTVGGRGVGREPFRLGRWRWPLFGVCLLAPLLSLVLPYSALLATSVSRAWGNGPVPGNLTLDWYRWALVDNQAARSAIEHSLTYAAAAATIVSVLALVSAYASARHLIPGAQILGFVAMAPFVVPGIVLAIGFYSAYARPPLLLYGTAWMLILVFATRFLPVAYSGSETALRGIDVDLESAVRTLGGSQLTTFRRVTVPLLRRSIVANWLLVFVPSLRELSAAIFLFTPATAVMSTLIFDLSDAGNFEPVSALGIIMMLLTFVLVALAFRAFGGAQLARSRGA